MSTTITVGASTITPTLVLGYETQSDSGNIVHDLLNVDASAVTLGGEKLRQGELGLFFATEAAAWSARTILKTSAVFTLASTDVAEIAMKFVRLGTMRLALDDDTRTFWILTVQYQEVPA